MAVPLHIACLQTRPVPSMAAAVDEAVPMAEAAAQSGAEMLFLPEYCGGLLSDGPRLCPPSAPEESHEVLAALREVAARRSVWMNIGSIAVDGPGDKICNRGYMIDPEGEILGCYDKIHLFDVSLADGAVYRESDTVQPGDTAVVYDTPLVSLGHTICYDLRFAALFRDLAKEGAEVIACPAAFTKTTGEAHWHVLNQARAIENTCFIVSACAVGPVSGGGASFGHSLVVSPWGDVMSDGGDLPGVVHAQLDLDLVEDTASRIPSLDHDRTYRVRRDRQTREVA
ncbi:MAG: carbon-nitrogen hydrolase family protein [Boseongicola sp.]|nr:carbon-nitrogen hydrolase family protein [Boseongicola sp.]